MDWTVASAGWDNATYTSAHSGTKKHFQNVFSDYAIQAEREGWNLKTKESRSGQTFQIRKAMYTQNPNGRDRLSMTGEAAALLSGENTPFHARCTRCDLQMTLRAASPCPSIISTEYQRLRKTLSQTKRKTFCGIVDSTTGRTMYYGKRANGNMGRVYDKGQQLKTEPPGVLIRWEVEWRKQASNQLYEQGKLREVNLQTYIDWVTSWFSKRHFSVPEVGQSTSIALQVAREASDTETQLKWLTEQVRPVLFQLASKGKLQAATEALGINSLE